jgi:lysosomal acid lipase/cholesteryl ester hydrolase
MGDANRFRLGWVLTIPPTQLHRVFPKQPKDRRGPVLLMHGFLGTSADFVLTGPNIALAYQLLNAGYHVFLGNCRGSKFSMKHKALDPLSREFWRFSVDEIGLLDLPAIVNYALFLTEKKSLFYVGHNQGATALLVLLSSRPRYNDKIIQAHFMGPIAFMDFPHPILAFNAKGYEESVRALKSYNFFSMVDFTKTVVDNYCSESIPGGIRYCAHLWEFIFGRNQAETEIDPKLLLDLPAFVSPTASVRQFLHFLQIHRSGKFQSYGRNGPPVEYKLTNVQVPVYLYHGAEDLIVSRVVRKIILFVFNG